MSDVYEVAFSGQIADGAELDKVKANIGTMFKADEAKLTQLFSGKRVVIKKNIDEATARKYEKALNNAGALCEVKNLSQSAETASVAAPADAPAPAAAAQPTPAAPAAPSAAANADYDIPEAPDTVPLKVSGDEIADLPADLAPVGSMMQEIVEEQVEPPSVPDDMTVAPVGSDIGDAKEEEVPPPPDTSGLSIVDN